MTRPLRARIRAVFSPVAVAAIGLVGCRDERFRPTLDQPSTTAKDPAAGLASPAGPGGEAGPIGGGPRPLGAFALSPTPRETIGLLTHARCAHAERCDHVGTDRTFGSEEQCLTATRLSLDAQGYLGACNRGIDRKALTRCLDALGAADCARETEDLEAVAGCSTRDLCGP
jgi:hypothetical protein